MVWFHVDDNLAFHPKAIAAGNEAMGLWVRAGAWATANLTDGFVPRDIVSKLARKRVADKLVSAGLWAEITSELGSMSRQCSGYQFHDWDHKQFTKAEVEGRRQWERDRKAEQRKRKHVPQGQPQGHDPPNDLDVPVGVPPGVLAGAPVNPTQPNPISGDFGGGTNVTNGAGPPPQKFCSKHPDGTDGDCGGCGAARRNHERWLAKQTIETKHAAQTEARAHLAARLAATQNCQLCDDNGYRQNGMTCDHIDRTETARRGRAAINKAMHWTP